MLAPIRNFFKLESAAGIILFIAAVLAVLVANSSFAIVYDDVLGILLPINLDFLHIHKDLTLKLWIDDGLMAIFFFLVGLELKREIVEGELSSPSRIMLPAIAAVGGVVLPAIFYVIVNMGSEVNLRGWAIPAATDIAFALGVLSLFGRRIPTSLKAFLVALAILDDIAAILIIALFYTAELSVLYLALAFVAAGILFVFNRMNIMKLTPYLIVGAFLWLFVLKSGIHATIAGVVLAFMIPIHTTDEQTVSPLKYLEHLIHPYVAFGILPVFAFANAGVSLAGFGFESLFSKVTLGVILGLFFGKQIGVMLMTYLSVKFKICQFPDNSSWLQFYGIALLTGIGFTMSLFVGNLAFVGPDIGYIINDVRIGVIFGSLLSAIFGSFVIYLSLVKKNK